MASEYFILRVTEKFLREFIEKDDCPVQVHPCDDAVCVLNQLPVFLLTFSQGFFATANRLGHSVQRRSQVLEFYRAFEFDTFGRLPPSKGPGVIAKPPDRVD